MVLAAGVARFPQSVGLARQWARLAEGDSGEALRRWAMFRERFPRSAEGYVGAIALLRKLRRYNDVAALEAAFADALPEESAAWQAQPTRA